MKIIDKEEFNSLIALDNTLVLDIREKYEIEGCSLSSSQNIPMSEVENNIELLNSFDYVILMCQSGKRASALGNYLTTEFKLEHLYVFEGGINAYLEIES